MLLSGVLGSVAQGADNGLIGIVVGSDSAVIHLSARAPYEIRYLPHPPRLAVDLHGVVAAGPVAQPGLRAGALRGVRGGPFRGGASPVARVVLDLSARMEHAAAWEGSALRIRLGDLPPDPGTARAASADQDGAVLRHAGFLIERNGTPASGTVLLEFSVRIKGREAWRETRYIDVRQGRFEVRLKLPTPVPEDWDASRAEVHVAPPAGSGWSVRDSGFVVQVGAFSERARAESLQASLGAAGSGLSIAARTQGGLRLWVVRGGPFADRRAAEEQAGRLAQAGQKPLVRSARP